MKWVLMVIVMIFSQKAFAQTDILRDQRVVGIPSMNKLIKQNRTAEKDWREKRLSEPSVKKPIVELSSDENYLIMQIQRQDPVINSEKNEGYLFINSLTSKISEIIGSDSEESKNRSRNRWATDLHPAHLDISNLIDSFFARNEQQGRIAVNSSKNDGFYIGSEDCCKGDRSCRGKSNVSIPVYDEKMGLVLVYRSIVHGPLAATGWMFLYSYDRSSGRLTLLRKENLWIS
jgi:hypothetical protein